MISTRREYEWTCNCGAKCRAVVWRILAEAERPEVFHAYTPGLVTVRCQLCGEDATIDDAVLLVRSSPVVQLVVAMSRRQLAEPTAVLGPLEREYRGASVHPPILLPRDRLPLVLGRDVDADVDNVEAAARAVLESTGDEDAAVEYRVFLNLVAQVRRDRRPLELVEELFDQPPTELARWLREHPDVHAPQATDALGRMADRAEAIGDTFSSGFLRIVERLLVEVAAGTSPEEAAAAYTDALAAHNAQVYDPHLVHLREVAKGGSTADAIAAARELVARYEAHPDPAGPLRESLILLGARLLELHDPDADDQALAVLERARSLSTTHDAAWVHATGNAGLVYARRTSGDAPRDWRRAVALLRDAIDASPLDGPLRGNNAMNLGLTLADRPGGSTPEDLDEAVQWLEHALAERPLSAGIEDWAFTKVNLGLAIRRRQASGDLAAAIGHFRDVVAELESGRPTRLLVHAQLNLASALLDVDPPEVEPALITAQAGGEAAARISDSFLLAWAARLEGHARARRARRQDAPDAIAAWERSVAVLDLRAHAAALLENGKVLAEAYQLAEQWEALADLYQRMLDASDLLYEAQTTPEGRRHRLAAHPRLARWAAYALARTGRIEAAVDALERARARGLAAATGRDTADLEELDRADPHLAAAYVAAARALRTATAAAADQDGAVNAEGELRDVLRQIRAIPGLERFLLPPPVADLLRLSDVGRVVYIAAAVPGTHLLSVEVGSDGQPVYRAIHVPEVTSADVAAVTVVDVERGQPGMLLAQGLDDGGISLADSLNRTAERLGPLLDALAAVASSHDGRPTLLVPAGLTGLLPLHALSRSDGTTLDDVTSVRIAPSLVVYDACRRRAMSAAGPPVFVAVADPTEDLPGARAEVDTIARLANWASVAVAYGQDATAEWLAARAPSGTHIHLACHGRHDLAPSAGGLLFLAGGERLDLPAIARLRIRARVAVASACQSGHFDTAELPDEFVGLPAGLLEAGAACAVATLWPVGDEAAALLMTRFYELLDLGMGGIDPPEALRAARLWLRDLTEEERESWLDARPALAAALRARGLPAAVGSQSRGPYAGISDWGAFVVFGA